MTQVSEEQIPGPVDLNEYRLELDRKRQQISTTEVSKAVVGGPGGPHDPIMEQRVATLEADMKDVKGSLNRIETTLAVMSETMKGIATKTEMVAVTGSVNALTERVKAVEDRSTRLEGSVSSALATAVGKAIGPGQLFGILAGMVGCIAAAAGFVAWLIRQPWFAVH